MENTVELKVHIAQDEESGRWYVAESDIPGLRLEADDAASLIERVRQAAPELIELNAGEILAKHGLLPSADKTEQSRDAGFRSSIFPVFDTPLALACA